MSLKRGLSALLAGIGAWAVLKGTAGAQDSPNQDRPRVIRVRKPYEPRSKPGNAFLGAFLSAITDENDTPIFGGGSVRSGSTGQSVRSGGGSIGQRLLGDLMSDFGLTRTQAAGFVGNLHHESAGFGSLQEINPTIEGSRGGYGYAQWTGPRRREYEAWSNSHGLDPASYEANYGFLRHELSNTWEKRVIPKLQGARTVEDATQIVQDVYLRPGIPHFNSRLTAAKNYT